MHSAPLGRLTGLIESGQLRFVYVIGVARSNSTILCRLLGAALDGAVYEPATPAALDRRRHFARTILRAYDEARRQIGPNRPVALAIKDLSLFLDDPAFAGIVGQAAHVVFSVRHPVAQQASLKRQLAQEFSFFQRVDAVVRYPFEALWMAWYFLVYGRRFIREASAVLGPVSGRLARLAMAGWNIESWRNMEACIAALAPVPFTVVDADALRRDPRSAQLLLDEVAASIAPTGRRAAVEVAGHSRMLPRSKWAAEALTSRALKPPAPAPAGTPSPDAFDAALLTVTEAAYERVRGAGTPRSEREIERVGRRRPIH